MKVTHHRFILSEINTHRAFSRNSASSRAIPVAKQIDKVLYDPALPIQYKYNQPGMQAADFMSDTDQNDAEQIIFDLRYRATKAVTELNNLGPINPKTNKPIGLHKQWANRYLEPFMWHTIIITSTEWDNFFAQRVSHLAQPELEIVARLMQTALRNSTPVELSIGEWHTPFIRPDEDDLSLIYRLKVSTARCARVSYLTHEGIRDVEKDVEMFNKLKTANPPHFSPLENVATPFVHKLHNPLGNFISWTWTDEGVERTYHPHGWTQLRHVGIL